MKAAKKPETWNPSTSFPANSIIIALITNKKSPNEIMVAGKVRNIISGLTNMFNNEITTATTTAVR